MGENQKSSERQMWVENKSGGETVRKVKHSLVRIENPIPALYRGTEYFSLARTFRTTWGGSKNKSGQKKTNEADPKGQPRSVYVLRAKQPIKITESLAEK